MIALIDLYRKQLLKVNGFSPSTVETYTLSIKAFCQFVKTHLKTDPTNVRGPQLLNWILYLKNTGIGHSRIKNHHYALKSFFAFLKISGVISSNPAQALPLLITRSQQVTKPISAHSAFKLLDSFDQSTWHGLRDYTMVAVLWALGLRTGELTSLKPAIHCGTAWLPISTTMMLIFWSFKVFLAIYLLEVLNLISIPL